jgi:hypothetical protein
MGWLYLNDKNMKDFKVKDLIKICQERNIEHFGLVTSYRYSRFY